tara:strand:+ start:563 stop:1318 length:756 start_codon:yes stop_codon:yes gene_type:complete
MAKHLFVAGNWKMNLNRVQAIELAKNIDEQKERFRHAEVVIFPSFVWLSSVQEILKGDGCKLGAQNCHSEPMGAHTGDVSLDMLKDIGCDYVILGHSERRINHLERSSEINKKVCLANKSNLISIVCVGETLEERNQGKAMSIVTAQLQGSIPKDMEPSNLMVAYEPVWAIGTGKTPTLNDIEEMHSHIRKIVLETNVRTDKIRILYGGSVKPNNAAEIFELANVDGALVGGASLSANDFMSIIQAGSKEK